MQQTQHPYTAPVSNFADDHQDGTTRRRDVDARLRDALTLLGFLSLAVVAYFAARHWQTDEASYTRVEPEGACDLRTGPCVQPVNGGTVTLAIQPADIPLMQPLRLRVVAEGLTEHAVQVEIRGLNMDMGLNRTSLTRTPGGSWEGETILPICSQRQMSWEAAVRLDADGQAFEVPFPFRTNRP
ncbi:MAG: hypothetical protein PVJ03_10405 [Chromatiaceae bacterium]|jgi:hypothetical protein